MKLEKKDYIVLSRAVLKDGKAGNLNMDSPSIIEEGYDIQRLIDAGMIDDVGDLTKEGFKTVTLINEKVHGLKGGRKFSERRSKDPHAVSSSGKKWFKGVYREKQYVTDIDFMLFDSRPWGRMKPKEADGKLRKALSNALTRIYATKNLVPVKPTIWRMNQFGGTEFITLRGEKTEVVVDAMYLDYLMHRFPTTKLYAEKGKKDGPIQCKCKQRGVRKDVIGILMPIINIKGLTVHAS